MKPFRLFPALRRRFRRTSAPRPEPRGRSRRHRKPTASPPPSPPPSVSRSTACWSSSMEKSGQPRPPADPDPGPGHRRLGVAGNGTRLQRRARLYVLTLPGFDGRPAAGPTPFATAQAAVAKLIAQRRLDKPVIVGHSLGATMAIALAAQQPASIGGVVAIDGLPVFPGTENMEPAQRQAMADGMKARMGGGEPTSVRRAAAGYMRAVGVVDMGKADDSPCSPAAATRRRPPSTWPTTSYSTCAPA
jgi:pimeloyl-ACP methyl ester carboxylesterase